VSEADGLIDLHRKGVLAGDSFEDRFSPLELRRKQIAEELATIEAEVDLLKIETLNADHILSETRDLYSKWPRLSKPEKRRVVEAITREIVVGKGEITFKMFYFPPLPPFGKELKKTVTTRVHPQEHHPLPPAAKPPQIVFMWLAGIVERQVGVARLGEGKRPQALGQAA
jgi:hypothetical protein